MLPYFVAWLCVPILSIPFFMHVLRFRFIDIHAFTWSQIYCHFFLYYLSFPVPACLDHITWSCTRVPVMHAIWLYICTCRVASDNPGFSCPDPGDRTLVALLWLIRVHSGSFRDHQDAAEAWIIAAALPPSSSPVWFSRPLLLLVSTSQLLYLFIWCTFVFLVM